MKIRYAITALTVVLAGICTDAHLHISSMTARLSP
jgi:hypothetical protein